MLPGSGGGGGGARFVGASRPRSSPGGVTAPPLWLTEMLTGGGRGADGAAADRGAGGGAAPSGGFRPYASASGQRASGSGSGDLGNRNASSGGGDAARSGLEAHFAAAAAAAASPAAFAAALAQRRAAHADVTSPRAMTHMPMLPLGSLPFVTSHGGPPDAAALRRINSSEMSAVIGLVSAAWTGWGVPGGGMSAAAMAAAAAAAAGRRS